MIGYRSFKRFLPFLLLLFSTTRSQAQCGAIRFFSPDTIICAPNVATFSIINLPSGASVHWDFGNGTLSGNTNPSRLYSNAGEYTIKLEVTLINNAVCTLSQTNYIKVKPPPKIDVEKNIQALCSGPDSIIIIDKSPNIRHRDYLLEGFLYTNVSPSFTYHFDSGIGPRSLFVFAVDSFGCRNTMVYDTFITVYSHLDSLGWDIAYAPNPSLCAPVNLQFQYQIPAPENHVFNRFSWQFPSATPSSSTSASPSNIRFQQGSHSVSFTITNSDGCAYAVEKINWLTLHDSVPAILTSNKVSGCAGEEFLLRYNATAVGKLTWSFPGADPDIMSINDTSMRVSFKNIGPVSPRVTYKNESCVYVKTFDSAIRVNGPNASFTIPVTKTCTLPFRFSAINTSDLRGSINPTFLWILENTTLNQTVFNSSVRDSFVFTIRDSSQYKLSLFVNGGNGCYDSSIVDNVLRIDTLLPEFQITPTYPCPGQNITINGTSETTSGLPNSYDWWVYDTDKQTIIATQLNRENIRFSVPDIGEYSFKMRVRNASGCTGTSFFESAIKVITPQPTYMFSDTVVCRNQAFSYQVDFQNPAFANYTGRWLFVHADSSGLILGRNGWSGQISLSVPGLWKVYFIYRSPANLCSDTLEVPQPIHVNGLLIQLTTSDPLFGCEPLKAKWSATILRDYHFGYAPLHFFQWKAQRNMQSHTVFSPDTGLFTDASYNRKGLHRTRLVVDHASGCTDSFYTQEFTAGSTANFSFGSSVKCINTTHQIVNQSLNATSFKWEVNIPGGVLITPSDTAKNPQIEVVKEGDFNLRLYAIGPEGCRDTFNRLVRVIDPKPDFMSPDTVQFCAPVVVSFTPSPVWYGNRYTWFFGDGDSFATNRPNKVSHVYTRNTDEKGLSVTLTVRTPTCIASVTKESYIKIIGPIPDYSFTVNNRCEPMKVNFVNKSKQYSRYFFDYGDGITNDTRALDDHRYMVQDKALNSQCYYTRLLLVDASGCNAQYQDSTPICVRKSGEPLFKPLDTVGCERFEVNFTNQSSFATSFKWDFKGDGNFVPVGTYHTSFPYDAGIWKPRIAAFNVNGCSDTSPINLFRIYAQPKPQSDFQPVSDSICFNTPLRFLSKARSSNKIIAHAWRFGDAASLSDTSSKTNPEYAYRSTRARFVQLVVTDSNQCRDTFGRFVQVIDTIPPVNDGFSVVSLFDNEKILTSWRPNIDPAFQKYQVFLDQTGYTQLYESSQRKDTQFLIQSGINVDQRRYCYTMKIMDTCGIISGHSKPHCTVYATLQKAGSSRLLLSWVGYIGWEQQDFWGYIVYRSDNGAPFKPVDTLNNRTDAFLDIDLCEIPYCYYVEAVHQNLRWRSVSNVVCMTPDYVYPTEPVIVHHATITNNAHVAMEWEPYEHINNLSHYVIHRANLNTLQWEQHLDTTHQNRYADFTANIHQNAYMYTVEAVDKCGFSAPPSLPATSLLLQSNTSNYITRLRWNHYREWPDGVGEYKVFFALQGEELQHIADVLPSDSTFEFSDIDINDNKPVCFRIAAVRNRLSDTSISNIICDIPESRVFIPNAFSPNQDRINEEFKPSAIYVHQLTDNTLLNYHMEVYDSWGNKLFQSIDLQKGWDGTYKGQRCSPGVYMYRIKVVGLDAEVYDFKGTFHLFR
jgi:gliding motility-associated-like protein